MCGALCSSTSCTPQRTRTGTPHAQRAHMLRGQCGRLCRPHRLVQGRIWSNRNCFCIYDASRTTYACRNPINKSGCLTVGRGPNMYQAWMIVLQILGLDETGEPINGGWIKLSGSPTTATAVGPEAIQARPKADPTKKRKRTARPAERRGFLGEVARSTRWCCVKLYGIGS